MKQPSEFSRKVIALIKKIPRGKVATYGQIARLAGKPHASRAVAWILHSCSESYALPWHRVLGSQGKISFPPATANHRKQRRLLLREGIAVSSDGKVDLSASQWKKENKPKSAKNLPRIFG